MAEASIKLKAIHNIPLDMCCDEKNIPEKLKKHAGGARIERGTEITVDKARGERLKALKYAE